MRQFPTNSQTPNHLLLQNPLACDNQERYTRLLGKLAEGDQEALASLYQDLCPLLFGLILRIVADRKIAEEILLEVFKQVYQQAVHYEAWCGKPLSWILNLARERALDCWRSGKGENKVVQPAIDEALASEYPSTPEKASLVSRQQRLARMALASLTATERQVIELAYFGGLRPAEIALRLELSTEAVQKHIRFAMMRLREYLGPVLQEQL
jgi:RNA polymerase sigma-70 factor (ECF subfamily)